MPTNIGILKIFDYSIKFRPMIQFIKPLGQSGRIETKLAANLEERFVLE